MFPSVESSLTTVNIAAFGTFVSLVTASLRQNGREITPSPPSASLLPSPLTSSLHPGAGTTGIWQERSSCQQAAQNHRKYTRNRIGNLSRKRIKRMQNVAATPCYGNSHLTGVRTLLSPHTVNPVIYAVILFMRIMRVPYSLSRPIHTGHLT